jgi:hypothetical protein
LGTGSAEKVGTREEEAPYQANHSLRKWFKTRCEIAGMKPINIETLLSHNLGVSDSYYRPTEGELFEDYLKTTEMLTVYNDKLILHKQLTEITDKSRNENYVIKGGLLEKEQQIQLLRQRDLVNTDAIANLSDQLAKITQEIELIKKQK